MSLSENQLNALATDNPKELARVLSSPNADVHTLTFGAEVLGGEVKDEELVLPVLRRLLKHVNAVVREGAMLGVSAFYIDKKPPQEIVDRLRSMVKSDPSPANRDCAGSMLEDYLK
jgi:hypothetical protein